jgi:gamma-tubulin complex component 3
MDQLLKNLSAKSPSLSSNPSENLLKLVTFQKKTSATSDLSTPSDLGSEVDGLQLSHSEDLIQEVIYSLTGKTGKYLKKDVTGEFKLDMKARNLSIQEASSLLRLADVGFIHNEIQKFTDQNSEYFLCGLFGQGLISHVKQELTDYYGLVATLQEKLNKQRNKSYLDWEKSENLSMIKVLAMLSQPANRLRNIHQILSACKNLKGGSMVSALYSHLSNGDPSYRSIVKSMLIAACRPLHTMLSNWLLEGEIKDPHNEFFIEEIKDVSSENLWHHKYRVMKARLPSFIPQNLAKKILTAGKSINFLREVCQDKSAIKGREELKKCFENNVEDLLAPIHDTKLHEMIDSVYLNTSKKVMDIAMGTYRLLEHLQAMRKYLLLGQGDFIELLMENLK